MHPLNMRLIHRYYLSYQTVYLEYKNTNTADIYKIECINDTLNYAAINGNPLIVKWCLKNRADVHAENDCALRYAAASGHLEVVQLLLAAGADIHIYNNSVLYKAARYGRVDVIRFILSIKNIQFSTHLILQDIVAAAMHGHVDAVKVLAMYL